MSMMMELRGWSRSSAMIETSRSIVAIEVYSSGPGVRSSLISGSVQLYSELFPRTRTGSSGRWGSEVRMTICAD